MLIALTTLGLAIAGYHPGCEDDGVYLSAIKRNLTPALYPHDADFFALQLQATVFDKAVAALVRFSSLPAAVVLLALHVATIFFLLWGSLRVVRRYFQEPAAHWLAVALLTVLLTLPIAGTALYLVDQNLHPRAMATAAILAAIVAVFDRRWILAGVTLVLAAAFHPMMASYGISLCVFLGWQPQSRAFAFALMPLGWVFEPTSKAWHIAAGTRAYYFLLRWEWYEWLGVFGPPVVLWWFRRLALRDGNPALARLLQRLLYFGAFQFAVAVAILSSPTLDRVRSFQPMRFLHLAYLLMVLVAGALAGRYLQRERRLRAVALLLPLAGVMWFAQRQTYPDSQHLELPGVAVSNSWLQAFGWIRENAPVNSLFALGPNYMTRPGEDFHSFRALAERSVLADSTKDASVATQVPSLAPLWLAQVQAQSGWLHFARADFDRLHRQFAVDWLVLEKPGGAGLDCPYENDALRVCRIGDPR